jgi:sugar phosphate isomerase/epimerase
MLCSLATKLDQGQIAEIEALAQDLGAPILAYSCYQAEAASIDDAQIARIKDLESKLGVSLVAVRD